LGADGLFCRRAADQVPCVVLDIDHSHGPEHPFPAALEDIQEAVRWIDANAKARGWDKTRVSIGGFSSGGALALAASSMEALRGRFRAVAAVYPS
jgi:acetyl esterase/lipase